MDDTNTVNYTYSVGMDDRVDEHDHVDDVMSGSLLAQLHPAT